MSLISGYLFLSFSTISTNLVVCCSQDFSLGGWSVERSVDGEPPIIYKFTPKYVLKTGSYVTVSDLKTSCGDVFSAVVDTVEPG